MIKRLLIANRGEVACRIMRTVQARGIHCVAVYSHCDKNSLHVQYANEAWCIGENPAQQSYLDSNKIIQIAKQSQCDAIHPGYGFLSENADFAEACTQQGIIFIGPPADAIRQMGSKIEAKERVAKVNIPLLPGLYFVAWQLDIAEGLPLPLQQDALSEQGHSIEVRLYAVDPQKDFPPSTGQLKQLQFPEENTDLRIDTGVKQSDEISAFYDPLLAKIISHDDNREQAIQKLLFALQQIKINGISSNLDYLKAILRSEDFHQGLLSTHFLEKHPLDFAASETERDSAFFIAALAFYLTENRMKNDDPWKKNIGWRLNQAPYYPITLRHFSSEKSINKNLSVTQLGKNNFSVKDEKGTLSIECFSSACEDQFQLSISDQAPIFVSVFRQKNTLTLHFTNYSLSFSQQKLSSNNFQKSQSSGSKFNHAPMSGRIVEIFCSSEQILAAGSPILAMEAMKMEHIIKAPEAGQVTQFHIQPESFIEEGSLLFDFQKDT